MKKVLIVLIFIIIVGTIVGLAAVLFNNFNKIEDATVNVINNNSNLPFAYLSEFDNFNPELNNYKLLDNYMSKDYSSNDISFSYYGYPNDESDYRLGEITLQTDKYDLLGVKVGDNMSQSISKIEKYGFELQDRNNSYIAKFKIQDITITLEADIYDLYANDDELVVDKICIKAESKYLGNRMY